MDAYEEGFHSECLNKKPFTAEFLRGKFTKWLTTVMQDFGIVTTPNALKKRMQHNSGAVKDKMEELRKAREKLTRNVVDPLKEAQEIGKKAGGRFLEEKQSARRLQFDEEDLEVDDPQESPNGTFQLSDVPKREICAKRLSKRSPNNDRKRRRGWTKEQKIAFKAALSEYGVGSWASIRDADEYGQYWKGKSNVQLKDLYRTMLKNKEVTSGMSIND